MGDLLGDLRIMSKTPKAGGAGVKIINEAAMTSIALMRQKR